MDAFVEQVKILLGMNSPNRGNSFIQKAVNISRKPYETVYGGRPNLQPIQQRIQPIVQNIRQQTPQILKQQYSPQNIIRTQSPLNYPIQAAKMVFGSAYSPQTRRIFPESPIWKFKDIQQLPQEQRLPAQSKLMTDLGMRLLMAMHQTPVNISQGLTPDIARDILKVKKGASQTEIKSAYTGLLKKEFPTRLVDLANKYQTNVANLVFKATDTLWREVTGKALVPFQPTTGKGIGVAPSVITPQAEIKVSPYQGQIGELEKRLDYLIGYQPQGVHWKQEYRMRDLTLEAAKQSAPAKVVQEIEKIQDKLDDLRFAKQELEDINEGITKIQPPADKKEAVQRMQHLLTYPGELLVRGYSRDQIKYISAKEAKTIFEHNVKPENHWTFVKKEVPKYTRSAKTPSGRTNPVIKRDLADFEKILDVKKKVNLLDYLRTPQDVLDKIGLGPEAKAIRSGYESYRSQLKEEIGKISQWVERAPGKDASQRIFKYLDGQIQDLSKKELRVADEIQSYLENWADKLDLPKDARIKYYITHLFEKGLIKREFDPELAKIIDEKVPGEVYDPFLQKRLGELGFKEDVWQALEAYVKRAVRKFNMDPALEQLKKSADMLDVDSYKYIQRYASRINLRPTEIDNLLDNLIKSTPIDYRFTQRPTAYLTEKFRQTIYRGALGLNIGSALKNLTQGVNTYAKLGEKYTALGYLDLVKRMVSWDFDELYRVGVLEDTFIQDRNLHAIKRVTAKIDQGLFFFFDTAEKINRGSAYFGAKKQALDKGLREPEAIEFGKQIVRDTQFAFSAIDNPVALSSDLVKTFTQFQGYSLRQAEFLAKMLKNREFGGLLRYIVASFVLILSVGRLFGMRLKDMIPSFRLDSPLTQIGKNVFGLLSTDEAKRKEALRELPKTGALLFPAGTQIKKTIEGTGAYQRGYSRTPTGRVRFPVEQKQSNLIRGGLFGQWNLPEAQEYFGKERQPLGEKQSELFKQSADKLATYREIIATREQTAAENKVKELVGSTGTPSYFGDKYFYLKDGEVKSVDLSFQPQEPELTGNEELDKKLISKYKGEITAKQNDIIELYEQSQLTADEAEEQLTELVKKKTKVTLASAKAKAKKARKITFKKLGVIKIAKTAKSKKARIVGIKIKAPPKIKITKPKSIYKITAAKKLPALKVPKARIVYRKPRNVLGAII